MSKASDIIHRNLDAAATLAVARPGLPGRPIAVCDCYCTSCTADICTSCSHIADEAVFRAVHPVTDELDELALAAAKPITLTARERFLVIECLQRMDVDTLNDDITQPTSGVELDAIVRIVGLVQL